MPLFTSLAALSQTPASNAPDGSVDAPSTIDDQLRLLGSFIAQVRDGKGLAATATLASASVTDIGAQNTMVLDISGTTGISSFGTSYNGPRFLRFTGALTLTHSSALNLPGAANITTTAGDSCIAIPNAAGNGWNVIAYTFATTQTWQDLTASRAIGTTYVNTTGRPIQVYASVRGTVAGSTVSSFWTINGVANIGGNAAGADSVAPNNTSTSAHATVPPGASYTLAVVQGTLAYWRELR